MYFKMDKSETPMASSHFTSEPSTPRRSDSSATDLGDLIKSDDVAVVGMACRVAGGNHSPEQLWQSILAKRDASSEIPEMRWEPYRRRDVRNSKELQKTTSRGYFLSSLEDFDPAFFGISPKEAEQMDPQQRLSLEVAWEALEDAGIDPKALSGSNTAVFMGVNSDDYSKLLLEDLPNVDAWMGIGTAYCGVPNRISYHLNLMGPSTAVDAACASSLVAIHHGRQAILAGESKVAIVGGVNALCGPGLTRVLDKAGAISPEGSCLSFDDNAHGYGRGEGAAIVILKHLGSAIRDGDNILALLKGSAVAQDGKTNGIMAPNAKAQELVARQALAQAKVNPETVQYVEAHATSTPLGDPTEVSAISAVYGRNRSTPVWIGSVKPNVGHLEAGAGAIGFIKTVMVLNKAQLPPQANLGKLNTKVDWEKSGTRVVRDAVDWPASEGHPRRAAVCSYGYGGTVSHAVIEQSPFGIPAADSRREDAGGATVLVISAPQEKRLARQAAVLADWLSGAGQSEDLQAIANTLALRRAHHDYRAAFVADSTGQAAELLRSFADGKRPEWSSQGVALGPDTKKDVVWVFSGHGAQWKEMGKGLTEHPVFHNAIKPLDAITQRELGYSAIAALGSGDFDESDRVQVLTYVVQVGLAAVLRSNGVRPGAIIGHSVGEVAAAVAAGCLEPEEGALIVTRRARLYARVKGLGAMFMVNRPFEQVESELGGRADVVAAIDSSPSSCVVSGSTAAARAYAEEVRQRGGSAKQVATDIAFHSGRVLEPLAGPLAAALAGAIKPRPAAVPLYSTSDPDARAAAPRDAGYWVRNMVAPVRLTAAVAAAAADGLRVFLEVSSHPIVAHSISETLASHGLDDDAHAVIATGRRGKPAARCVLQAVGALHAAGAAVQLGRRGGRGGRGWSPRVPGTQWVHSPVWRTVATGSLGLAHDAAQHTLLGLRIPVAGTATVFATRLDADSKPFPGSHPLHGTEIVPAAVLLNTLHRAAAAPVLCDVVLRVPVAINAPRDVQVVVAADSLRITSRLQQGGASDDHAWVTHTTARWSPAPPPAARIHIAAVQTRIGAVLPPTFSVDYLAKVGVSAMGFPWAVTEHHGNLKEMLARIDVCPDADAAALPWDPASWAPILDAATSVGSTIFFDNPKLRMPAQIARVLFAAHGTPPPKTAYLHVEEASERGAPAVHVSVCRDDGLVLAKLESMRFSEIEGTPGASGSVESLVHQLAWVPAPFSTKPAAWDGVVVVSDDAATRTRCGAQLELAHRAKKPAQLSSASQIAGASIGPNTAVVYCPGPVSALADVPAKAEFFAAELLALVKHVVGDAALAGTKVFAITAAVAAAPGPTALAHAPLHGLARIVSSEHPDQWGALVDVDDDAAAAPLPALAMKYVRDQDVVRVQDGLPRVARLQPLPRSLLHRPADAAARTLLPRPEGTYVVTGGLGALGLEVAEWLVARGARRVVLVSRRALPPRRRWAQLDAAHALRPAVDRIQALERAGASVHGVAVELGAEGEGEARTGAGRLVAALDGLDLPPVLGVVHAAGTLEDQLVLETTASSFARVLQPKVAGALALHRAFPPATLDWFVLFSSCGQLFGFPGQSSYASGNAFLDALAVHRRARGDNAVAFQWTSWRGLGMAASTDFIDAELQSKGITSITPEEAFRAWEHVAKYDVDHAVVLRSLAFDEGEPLPVPILEDIAVRRIGSSSGTDASPADAAAMPAGGPELKAWLNGKIRDIIANVLMLGGADEVDPRAAIADLGVDSVMTVALRRQLQSALKVKVPPTLTWSHPTANHLTGWFVEKLNKA